VERGARAGPGVMARLRAPDLVAGAAGIALIASMFLHWYGVDVLVTGGPPQRAEATAWQAFSVLDVVLALLALVPLALVLLQATRRSPALPVLFSVLTTVAGLLAALLIAYRLANQPGPNDLVDVERGAWLGLLAALAIAAGGWRSTRDESMPGAPPPVIEHQPTP